MTPPWRRQPQKKKVDLPDAGDLPASFSLDLSATLHASNGRGLDLTVRRADGKGVRIALGLDALIWANPLTPATWLVQPIPERPHRIWIAVVDDRIAHVYWDGAYLQGCPVGVIHDLDADGMNEVPFERSMVPGNPANLIDNPDFARNTNNSAPEGWLSEKPMGGGTNPRVQVDNAEWPGQAVFTIRLDNDAAYGTWFAYPVKLNGNTWYESAWDNVN